VDRAGNVGADRALKPCTVNEVKGVRAAAGNDILDVVGKQHTAAQLDVGMNILQRIDKSIGHDVFHFRGDARQAQQVPEPAVSGQNNIRTDIHHVGRSGTLARRLPQGLEEACKPVDILSGHLPDEIIHIVIETGEVQCIVAFRCDPADRDIRYLKDQRCTPELGLDFIRVAPCHP